MTRTGSKDSAGKHSEGRRTEVAEKKRGNDRSAGNRSAGKRSTQKISAARSSSSSGLAVLPAYIRQEIREKLGGRPQEDEKKRIRLGDSQKFALWLMAALVLMILVGAAGTALNRSGRMIPGITESTVKRKKLEKAVTGETAYLTDELGLIADTEVLEKGMRYYYRRTGVQPYLYLAELAVSGRPDSLEGLAMLTDDVMAAYADELYGKLFEDEGHLLVLISSGRLYNHEYRMYAKAGTDAAVLEDEEALKILKDYVDRFYFDRVSYPEGRADLMFSDVFRMTAKRIMRVERSPWLFLLVLTLCVILTVITVDYRRAKQKLEAERLQKEEEMRAEQAAGETAAGENNPVNWISIGKN